MGGTREHYAKLNKSDRKRQILHDFTYMQNLKETKQMNAQNKTETEPQIERAS